MWIVARLVVAAAALAARFLGRLTRPSAGGEFRGTPYYLETLRSRGGRVTRLDLGMPLKGRVVFALTREGSWDRWFKAAGLAEEFQTGDAAFDETVYVACDHPAFAAALRQDEAARGLILEAFRAGFDRVSGDGGALWLRSQSLEATTDQHLTVLNGLRLSLDGLEASLQGGFADPFLGRALLVEGLVWSLAGYAFSAAIEWAAVREDYHLQAGSLVVGGLILSALLGGGLLVAAKALLGGSSRGHRVLIEGAALLALSLPVAGVQGLSDLNRGLDRAEPLLATRTVARTEKRVHRGRRGRRSYSYHLHLAEGGWEEGPRVPSDIRVSRGVFDRCAAGGRVRLAIGPGALGLPWYRSIEPL